MIKTEFKYLFGSRLVKVNTAESDYDYVTFVKRSRRATLQRGYRSIEREKERLNSFIQGRNVPSDAFKSWIMYQLSSGFQTDEEYPFNDFNILEHKEVWAKQLKGYMSHERTEKYAIAEDTLPKKFYHILYQYYMITENTHWISDEAKAHVQKLHDLNMPSSYFYELRDLINSLEITV